MNDYQVREMLSSVEREGWTVGVAHDNRGWWQGFCGNSTGHRIHTQQSMCMEDALEQIIIFVHDSMEAEKNRRPQDRCMPSRTEDRRSWFK